MNLYEQLREKIRMWFLAKTLKKVRRNKKIAGYKHYIHFGILYDASSEENYKRITLLVKDLQHDQKKVKTLGFVNQKKMPEYSFPKLTFEFCNKKAFALNYHPQAQGVKDFLSQKYDVIIDLSNTDFFHLKFVAALSDAPLKVGRFDKKYVDLFDVMLELKEDAPIDEVINQTMYYLKMINNA
ncbi:MAG: DUF6913 domain-containing protein [Bacteroidota bacterium]